MLAETNADFAFRVYRRVISDDPEQNVFFSPFSICVVLAMALEGAAGATADEIARVLSVTPSRRQQFAADMSKLLQTLLAAQDNPQMRERRREIESIRQALAELRASQQADDGDNERMSDGNFAWQEHQLVRRLNRLLGEVDQFELSIASALFGEQRYGFKRAFVDSLNSLYGSGLVPCDFANNASGEVQRINRWAREQTNGNILNPLPVDTVSADTPLVAVNAIYFKGEWQEPFRESATKSESFTGIVGAPVMTPLMNNDLLKHGSYAAFNADGSLFPTPQYRSSGTVPGSVWDDQFGYPGNGGAQVLELPYKGGEISMLILLPRAAAGLAALESGLDAALLNRYLDELECRSVSVTLPRFKTNTRYELNAVLSALGMLRAFQDPTIGEGADFSAMADAADEPIYISLMIHQAMCDVNEKGTEAAAVSVLTSTFGAIDRERIPFVPVIRADRPFLYLIVHRRTRTVLFLGRMANAPE